MLSSVEFIPQGNVKYLLRLTYGEPESEASSGSGQSRQAVSASPAQPAFHNTPDDFDLFSSSPDAPAVSAQPAPVGSGNNDPELEKILRTTRRTIYKWIDNGEIRAFKVGRSWRVSMEDLKAFLQSRTSNREK